MKEIPLTQGKVALVDDEDYERLSKFKWRVGRGYARRVTPRPESKTVVMHREIIGPSSDAEVDHINQNRLDNRRANLRICTHRQNSMNRPANTSNKSGYKGVYWKSREGKWTAAIRHDRKVMYLGLFDDAADAARAYDAKAYELHGEFAYLNFPGDLGKFDAARFRKWIVNKTPVPSIVEATKNLMAASGYTVTDLGKLFGSCARASQFLSGKRNPSLRQIDLLKSGWGLTVALTPPRRQKGSKRG